MVFTKDCLLQLLMNEKMLRLHVSFFTFVFTNKYSSISKAICLKCLPSIIKIHVNGSLSHCQEVLKSIYTHYHKSYALLSNILCCWLHCRDLSWVIWQHCCHTLREMLIVKSVNSGEFA